MLQRNQPARLLPKKSPVAPYGKVLNPDNTSDGAGKQQYEVLPLDLIMDTISILGNHRHVALYLHKLQLSFESLYI